MFPHPVNRNCPAKVGSLGRLLTHVFSAGSSVVCHRATASNGDIGQPEPEVVVFSHRAGWPRSWLSPLFCVLLFEANFTRKLGLGYPRQLRLEAGGTLRTAQTDSGTSVFTLLLESSVMLNLS